jgi:hypothetical protein
LETARLLVEKENADKDRITELKITESYQQWQLPQFYQTNISFLCEYLSSANGENQAN